MFRYFAIVFVLCSILCVFPSMAETNRFTFCSRILSADENANVDANTKSQGLGASETDPVGCKSRGGAVAFKDGLQASGCQESVIDLTGSESTFARRLDAGGKSGSLHAFGTDISFDAGIVKRTVCFRHDVPMGGSSLSDDSPRCFKGNNQPFLMFIAKTCSPDNSTRCTTHWLLAIDGKCNGGPVDQLANVGATNGEKPKQGGGGVPAKEKSVSGMEGNPLPPPVSTPELSNVPLPPVTRDG